MIGNIMEQTQIDKVKTTIVEYFVERAGVPQETLSTGDVTIESLGIDSLSMIEMLWEVEEKYGVQIQDLNALKGMTLDMLASFVSDLVPQAA